jgi:DNA-binding HxlR family transcriptional regulator
VVRIVVPDSPVRVEYDLTSKGRELQDALKEIGAWAERWIPLEDVGASKSTGAESKARNLTPSRHARKAERA